MSNDDYRVVFSIGLDPQSSEYFKAHPGSFDTSFFTDPGTGKFRFPDYNERLKGLVRIEDHTNYSDYTKYLSEKKKANFDLDDFEQNFSEDLVVESFPAFMARFPEACFDKGISRQQLFSLFDEFRYFTTEQHEYLSPYYYKPEEEIRTAINLGLFTEIDPAAELNKHWLTCTLSDLQDLCKEHNIKPASTKSLCITRLMEANVPLPVAIVYPTELFKTTYWSFIDMYINSIKEQVDHMHPLYFEPLWKHVARYCDERGARRRAEAIGSTPYWANRLCIAKK